MVEAEGRQGTPEVREQGRILIEYVLLVVLIAVLAMTTILFLGMTIRALYDRTEAALFSITNGDSQGNPSNEVSNQGKGRWNGSGNQGNGGSDQGNGSGNGCGNRGKH